MSSSVLNPNDLNSKVAGNFLFLSMIVKRISLMSVVKSIHEPLIGMILALYSLAPFG